jgi:hypothetical protein
MESEQKAYDNIVQPLRAKAKIEIHEDVLAKDSDVIKEAAPKQP